MGRKAVQWEHQLCKLVVDDETADAFEQTINNGGNTQQAIDTAAKAAREQVEETKAWIAKRGRASYTGERSKDTYDAGAVAVAMMFENVAAAWEKF